MTAPRASRRRSAKIRDRLVPVALGIAADRVFGEPPPPLHPVAAFGRAMGRVESSIYSDQRAAGVAYTATGVVVGAGFGLVTSSVSGATSLAIGGRALVNAALEIHHALDVGDLVEARRLLPALVGRDPSNLDEQEIARAVVESVAENTVDAVVAPVWWAMLAGAPGALGYRAVNTMDAMVGYRSARYEHFGWASARLDDATNWIPARLTAALVMAARPRRASAIASIVHRDASRHPSPNAGVAEAAFAAALDLRLGGTNTYGDRVEQRAELGDGRPPTISDIPRACRLSTDVAWVAGASLVAARLLIRRAARPGFWRRSADV